MHHMTSSRRKLKPAVVGALLVVLAGLALAACGGSSTSSAASTSTSTSASSTPATGTTGKAPAGGASRFTALRECLEKNGITLPKFTPGQRPSGGTHGPTLPQGVSKSQYEAALKKCGGGRGFLGGSGGASRFNSPAVKQALAKFSTCMSENGVKIPTANTSGKGPDLQHERPEHEQRHVQSGREQVLQGSRWSLPWRAGRRRQGTGWPGRPRRSADDDRLQPHVGIAPSPGSEADGVRPGNVSQKRVPGTAPASAAALAL